MSSSKSEQNQSGEKSLIDVAKTGVFSKFIVPIVVGLCSGAFTGAMGAYTAIAVLEERVNKLEVAQSSLEVAQATLSRQQQTDGRTMVRIETKVDMLLAKSATGSQ